MYFVVMRVGWTMSERRVHIRGGVCAVVIVDNIVGNGSLGLLGRVWESEVVFVESLSGDGGSCGLSDQRFECGDGVL